MPLPGTIRAPKLAVPDSDDDPYIALVKAIVHRAVLDALGQCSPAGALPHAPLIAAARAWLAEEAQVAALVELAGFDSAPVVRRVRQLLRDTAATPAPAPDAPTVGQLPLFTEDSPWMSR